jgi:hypothetical protein
MFAARLLLAQELFDQEFRLTLLGLCGFFPSPRSVSNDITLQPVDYHRRQRLLSKASTRDRAPYWPFLLPPFDALKLFRKRFD